MNSCTATKLLSGKLLAAKCHDVLCARAKELQQISGDQACLEVVLVGDDPASLSYVNGKKRAAAKVGIASNLTHLAGNTSQLELNDLIERLAANSRVDGILVQSPLPPGLDQDQVTDLIPPAKDVDCFHPYNTGSLFLGSPRFLPCTPHGIFRLLQAYKISTAGKHIVIIGRSNIVGKPLAQLLLDKKFGNATVTVAHSATTNLADLSSQADILVCAIGKAELISADMIKPGAVVIDVGVNRVEDSQHPRGFRLVGDVCFEQALTKAAAITPVPGGVGPMTITMLLYNTLKSAYIKHQIPFAELNWEEMLREDDGKL